ncbi:ABC transporter substrate-binding protein [Pedobacter sp. MW01-1-1]|uniref:ABC transporter substrate-binding protein n=1 Tax=Pedobacter sp. MW01-1-1 TaxID=3383027 RepID=UPI003FEE823F
MQKNTYAFFLLLSVLIAACSSKVRTPKSAPSKPVEKEIPVEKSNKKIEQAGISLLVPFRLNDVNFKTLGKTEVEKYAMPIDFYQGFKLGLDSAAGKGQNFKLNVFDTEDDNSHISSLYTNDRFKQSRLIVGPVFPDGLKYISNYSKEKNILVVSPLAASQPAEFNNPKLVSIVGNINLHGEKIAHYIGKTINSANTIIVLINPKKTEDEQFAAPIRNYFQSNVKVRYEFQEYASVYSLETKLQKGKNYVVVVASSDRAFVVATLDRLIKIKAKGYVTNVYGHPNWAKQNYPTEKVEALNTIISSTYKVDYKNQAVASFIKKYRAKYSFEPSEYAYKGFDIGYYFGTLLANYGEDYASQLTKVKYNGLHNAFSFIYDEKLGYINTSILLLKYKNFGLNMVQ